MFKKLRKTLANWWVGTGKSALIRWYIWPPEREIEPEFLLPETAEKYRQLRSCFESEDATIRRDWLKEVVSLEQELWKLRDILSDSMDQSLSAQVRRELALRESVRLEVSIAGLRFDATKPGRWELVAGGETSLSEKSAARKAEEWARATERREILREGIPVFSGAGKQMCRIVVIFRYTPFLCGVEMEHVPLQYLDSRKMREVTPLFLTSSLDQMSDEELRAIEGYLENRAAVMALYLEKSATTEGQK